jgi:exopolyphosphatase/guanosine-5'-triphosphate,3'-diphosphate pyrophosphatase
MNKKITAVIEIASNELRLKVAERKGEGIKLVDALNYPLSLGKDTFHSGKISFESICKTAEIINGFKQVASEYGADKIQTIATTAVREATNREYVLDQLKIKTGLELEVIDDSREKNYINTLMLGTLPNEHKESAVVVHLGSGNISISLLENSYMTYTQSIKIGGLRLSEMFEMVGVEKYSSVVREYLRQFLDNIVAFLPKQITSVILTGYDVELVSGLCNGRDVGGLIEISRADFSYFYKQTKEKSPSEIAESLNMSVDKQEIILPALLVYNRILKYSQTDKMVAVPITAGDALLWESLQSEKYLADKKHYELCALAAAHKISKRFAMNMGHIHKIEECALMIFDKLKKVHGLSKRERFLLQMTVILHNVGKFINPKAHYLHSYNIINGLDIVGISEEEKRVIATAALYHGSILPDMKYSEYAELTPTNRVLVSKLCAILRLAVAVCSGHGDKYESVEVRLKGNELIVTLVTYKDIELERWSFNSKNEFFTDVYGIRAVLNKRSVI